MKGTWRRLLILLFIFSSPDGLFAQQNQFSGAGPEFGRNDIALSDIGITGSDTYDAMDVAITYNSRDNEFLLVWAADDVFDGEFEIFVQRIDAATGEEVGANDIQISEMGAPGFGSYDAVSPAVAYNSTDNEYLVVWHGDDFIAPLVNNEFEIFGQLLDAAGNEIGADDFRISFMGADGDPNAEANNASVAYNSRDNKYLVVYNGDNISATIADNEMEIFGTVISADGAISGAPDIRFSDMGPDGDATFGAFFPAVAYNAIDNEYLIVWEGDDNSGSLIEDEFEIYAQRVDAATLGEVGTNDFRISELGPDGDAALDANQAALAFNSKNQTYLAVWYGDDNTAPLVEREMEIYGQMLDASGAQIGSDFRISTMGIDGNRNYGGFDPAVVYNSAVDEYVVVWHGDDNTAPLVDDEFEIFLQKLDGNGNEIAEDDLRISDMGTDGELADKAFSPAIVYNSFNNEYIVAWEGKEFTGLSNGFEVYGQRIAARPQAPVGLTVAAEELQLDLAWQGNRETIVNRYYIYRDTSSPATTLLDSVSATSYSDFAVAETTRYYYRIAAADSTGLISDFSLEVDEIPLDATAPAPPQNLQATAGENLTDLQWDANNESDFVGYQLYRNTSDDFASAAQLAALAPMQTSYRDSALAPQVTLYYWLTATDRSGNESAASLPASATPFDTTAPAAPAVLSALGSDQRIDIDWPENAESDLAGYIVYRNSENNPATADSLSALAAGSSNYSDLGLSNGDTWYYWVTARDLVGNESGFSPFASASALDNIAPVPPQMLTALGGDGLVNLNWGESPEADLSHYILYRNTENSVLDADSLAVIFAPQTVYADIAVINGTSYYYWLTAVDSTGNESAFSLPGNATPQDATAPAIPHNLTAVSGDLRADLGWAANEETDLEAYTVYRNTLDDPVSADSIARITAGDTVYTDFAVSNGTMYIYWVTALDTVGNESGFSIAARVTPIDNVAPAVPQELTAEGGDHQVQLHWASNGDPDLAEYIVYRGTINNLFPTDTLATIAAPDTGYLDEMVSNGTEYIYWVTARDVNGNESRLSQSIAVIPQIPLGIAQHDNLPRVYRLYENYPNPFNPSTTVEYDLPEVAFVYLSVYNLLGQEVRVLVQQQQDAGRRRVVWDGRNNSGEAVSSGVYLYRLEAQNFVQTRKLMLVK